MRSVSVKTENLCGIHSRRTCVNGIEIFVNVEHYVVHRKGLTVGEFKIVFDNKLINGVAFRILFVGECFYDGRFVVARGSVAVTVGREHTYLRHSDYVVIGACGRIERVEIPL